MNTLTKRSAEELAATDSALWDAVQAHDRLSDGRFVYAVTSTGVYCRPSCPSRRPRRDRVRFFEAPDAARAAGFRACKRCKPDAAEPVTDPWIDKIRRALRVPHERRGPAVAGHAGRAARRQPLSSAAQLQASGRGDATRVRGRRPSAKGEGAPSAGRRHHRRHDGRRLRVEQPLLRARRTQAGNGAVRVPPRRRGNGDRLRDCRLRPVRSGDCWSRPRREACAPSPWGRPTRN